MGGDIADSPVMEILDDNQGFMIIHDESYIYYLTSNFSLFSKGFD